MNRILIVEDEKPISRLIEYSLTGAGYSCVCAYDGAQAAMLLEEESFDMVLLDVMLPEIDGYELMEYIRPLGIPVIFLTAKAEVKDRVHGLKLGADDYLAKPFEIIELLARVETVLRRCHKLDTCLSCGNVTVDLPSHVVSKDGQPLALTRKEYGILVLFLQNPGIALFRERIYEQVWGGEYTGDSRTVDLHVQRLRRKLGWDEHIAGDQMPRIVPVYKVGYRLEVGD